MNIEQLRQRLRAIADRLAVIRHRSAELGSTMTPLLERSELDEASTAALEAARTEFEALEAERDGDGTPGTGLEAERAETERLIGIYERAMGSVEVGNAVPGQNIPGADAPNINRGAAADPFERPVADLDRSELRDSALRAIEGADFVTDDSRGQMERLVRFHGDDLARHMLATGTPAYREAWAKAISGRESEWTDAERAAVEQTRAMSLTDGQGGYAVPFTLDPTIIMTTDGSVNPMRQIARVESITTDAWHGVASGGVTSRWAAEATEANDDSPSFTQPAIPVHKADSFVQFSVEIEGDFARIAESCAMMFAEEKDDLEAAAHMVGTGTGQPTGIVTALDAVPASEVAVATPGTYSAADFRKIWTQLPERYRSRATWLMNAVNMDATQAFGNNGDADFTVYLTAEGVQIARGRPLREASAMSDDHIVFGDMRSYVVVDRVGMSIEYVPQLFGANGRPTGQRGFYAWWRTGGDVVNPAGARLLNIA